MPIQYSPKDIFPLTIPLPASNTPFTPLLIGAPMGAVYDAAFCLRTHGLYDKGFKAKLPPTAGGGAGDYVNTGNYVVDGTFEVNNTTKVGGPLVLDGAQILAGSDPGANTIYPNTPAKAWGYFVTDGSGNIQIASTQSGVNIDTVAIALGGQRAVITFKRGFAAEISMAPFVQPLKFTNSTWLVGAVDSDSVDTTPDSISVSLIRMDTGVPLQLNNFATVFCVLVHGRQNP